MSRELRCRLSLVWGWGEPGSNKAGIKADCKNASLSLITSAQALSSEVYTADNSCRFEGSGRLGFMAVHMHKPFVTIHASTGYV